MLKSYVSDIIFAKIPNLQGLLLLENTYASFDIEKATVK